VTGYYLSIGYNSSHGGAQAEIAFDRLVEQFEAVLAAPNVIVDEVLRLETSFVRERVLEYAEWYTHPDRKADQDCSYRIYRKPQDLGTTVDPEEFEPYIAQYASGGGTSRTLKESVRRAVCRLVIEGMHRRHTEVNFEVK
jgi:hypothetical protein